MANLQDIIKIAQTENGKFFVMDEHGDINLVILGMGEYERLQNKNSSSSTAKQEPVEDIEKINKEILTAQLQEPIVIPVPEVPEIILPDKAPRQDLRSEVIDPSFNFDPTRDEFDV